MKHTPTTSLGRGLSAAVLLFASAQFALAQSIVTSPPQGPTAQWSAADRASAQPAPMPTVTGRPTAAASQALQAAGDPEVVPGNTASNALRAPWVAKAQAALQRAVSVEPEIGPGSTEWYSYPPPSTLYIPILDYVFFPSYPHSVVGKLFFNDVVGGGFVCSAQSVTSAGTWGAGNRQTVVTAGHCCSDGNGNFHNSWRFEPAHLNGAAPFGAWTANNATVYTAWHTGADLSVDYCVLQMNTLGNQNINDSIGSLGYASNLPLPQAYHATGWPAAAPFSGGLLFIAATSDAETDTNQAGLLPFTHGVGSTMTGGSSGGAWIGNYQPFVPGASNLFNGLNSYMYINPNRPAEMFGPYIDATFVNLLEIVATQPPVP